GVLRSSLEARAREVGCLAYFTGFVNQGAIGDYYYGADVVALPSRRAGETWGLVVNEALHAGCAVVMSEAVGCSAEFGRWERVRVAPDGDPAGFAQALAELLPLKRDFDWAEAGMANYEVASAAQ